MRAFVVTIYDSSNRLIEGRYYENEQSARIQRDHFRSMGMKAELLLCCVDGRACS